MSTIRRAQRAIARRVQGQLVVVSIPSLEARVLNDVGARVWELADGRSIEDVAITVSEEFEVPLAEARADVEAFVAELAVEGLVVRSG